jgi:hypothetical protein
VIIQVVVDLIGLPPVVPRHERPERDRQYIMPTAKRTAEHYRHSSDADREGLRDGKREVKVETETFVAAVCSHNLIRIAMMHIQRLVVTYESALTLDTTKDSCLN